MKKGMIALVVVAVVLAVLIYINRKNVRDQQSAEETCPDFTSQYEGKPSLTAEDYDMGKKVHLGDYGSEVAYLQQRLNTQYGASVTVDGKFGCETWAAVKEFTGLDSVAGIDLNDLK